MMTPVDQLQAGDVVRWLGTEWTALEVAVTEHRVVVRYDAGQPIRYAKDEAVDVLRSTTGAQS